MSISKKLEPRPSASVLQLLGGGFANASLYRPIEVDEHDQREPDRDQGGDDNDDVHLVYGLGSGPTLLAWLETSVKSAMQMTLFAVNQAHRKAAMESNPGKVA